MLRVTHTSSVTEDQIDHLGHMNVRYYAVNALAGTKALLGDRPFLVDDMYTRHLNEQLLGSPLVVRSGFLAVSGGRVRIHHELANADTGVLAATFVHGVRVEVDEGTVDELIPHPDYAAPRTISLDADILAAAPTLESVQERGLELRRERRIGADECDESGEYRLDLAPMLVWGGQPVEDSEFVPIHVTDDGVRMGWASMETRIRIAQAPHLGARVQAFGATVAIADKTTHNAYWTYDLDSGSVLTGFEVVSLAFDIANRKAMSLPASVRERELRRFHPDLLP